MAAGAETVQVAGNDSQDMDALASEGDAQSTLTTQHRHRQPHAADDEVAVPEDGENADASKPKKSRGHHQTTASDDGHSHGFLPGIMKQLGLGGHQEVKENNTPHPTDSAHPSDMPSHSGSHGFLPGLMKKVGRHDSHEFKSTDGEHHQPPHHHRHGTRDKELFGSEDAEGNYREHKDLFGSSDMDNSRNIEKADSLFGYEDKKFEAGEKGRDLFGDDDPNTLSNRDRMNLLGSSDGDEGETRHVFGEENTEDSDEEGVGSEEHEKDVHHGRSD